jgi:ABC-type amino acid transport substrate-binding protein
MRRSPLSSVTLAVLAAILAIPLPLSAADAPVSATLDRIKRAGTITFAYRDGAAPFSFKARNGQVRGYSVELCQRVATAIQKDLGLASLKVNWVPADAARRIETVASGKADAECGTTSITLARMQTVDFSVPIFVDGGSVLVKRAAKLAKLTDLKGRRIAVIPGTTTERALNRALEAAEAAAILVPVKDGAAGIDMLARGSVDGYAGDRVVLTGLQLAAPASADYEILAGDFSVEPFAIVVPRNDADFRLAVNRALVAVYRSGDIDAIFQRWLGGMGAPSPLLHALFYLNMLPE